MSNPTGDGAGKPTRVYGKPEGSTDETEATQASSSEDTSTSTEPRRHRRAASATRLRRKNKSETTPATGEQSATKPRYEPSGPVPVTGLLGLLWKWPNSRLYARFGWTWLLKRTNRERYNVGIAELWDKRKVQKIVAFVNRKGGSAKTACTVWLSIFMFWAIKRHIVAIDSNENSGHTASRLNIHRKSEALKRGKGEIGTIELREFLQSVEHGLLASLSELTEVVDWDKDTGVTVVASDPSSNVKFTQVLFQNGLLALKRSAHHVFCDLGNGIPHPANVGSVNLADTLVFTGNVNMADSLPDITNTMTRYTDMGYPQKVANGIIVIVGAKVRQRKDYAVRYGYPAERVFVIPRNRYMKSGKPARMSRVPLRIRAILVEILVAIINAKVVPEEVNLPIEITELVARNEAKGRNEATDTATEHHEESTPQFNGSTSEHPSSLQGSLVTAQLSEGSSS